MVLVRSADVDVLSGDAIDLRMLRRLEHPGGLFEIYDQEIRPDAVQHSDGHPGTEHHVVLSGCLRINAHGQIEELGPGDYLAFRAAGPHSYEARGRAGAVGAAARVPAGRVPDGGRRAAPAGIVPGWFRKRSG